MCYLCFKNSVYWKKSCSSAPSRADKRHCNKYLHIYVCYVEDKSWEAFLRHESMAAIMSRAAFIHVDIPGQEDGAPDLPTEWVIIYYEKHEDQTIQ